MKQKTFTVSARLNVEVSTTVKAESYEEVLPMVRKLRADDFVTIPSNCWMDGDIDKITFISEDN